MKAYVKPQLLKVSINASEAFLGSYASGCTPNYSTGDQTSCQGQDATLEGIFVGAGFTTVNCYTTDRP